MNNRYYERFEREYIREQQALSRRLVIRKQLIVLMAIFFLFAFSLIILLSGKVYADSSNGSKVKMYKSILVYAGDTLESIADNYMTDEYKSSTQYINEVASINGFSSDIKLIPGNHIIVPYYTSNPEIKVVEQVVSMNPTITISEY